MIKPIVLRASLVAVAAAFGVAGVPAGAEAAPAEKQEAADAGSSANRAGAKPRPATKFCLIEEMTGSRLGKKTCLTRAEWKARGVEIAIETDK